MRELSPGGGHEVQRGRVCVVRGSDAKSEGSRTNPKVRGLNPKVWARDRGHGHEGDGTFNGEGQGIG